MAREKLIFYALYNPWVTTNLVSSLVISSYSSGMLIYKLWGMSRTIRTLTGSSSSGKRLMRLLVIMIESSLLQTTMTVCILVSFQVGLFLLATFTALQPVVFGISVVLIHARVGLGWAEESYMGGSTPTQITLNLSTVTSWKPEEDLEQGKIGPLQLPLTR
ncbi:hypothetical protein FB451DRAFT_1447500 [Mycena latifolia]|nr:hypothetical protein FB451DRAFT_1447500 [Mycena latifolia]